MTYAAKLRLDRLVGRPVVGALALLLAWLPGRRRRAAPHGDPACVVVGKIVGLGSLVRAGALLADVAQVWPAARLVVLTRKDHAALALRMPMVAHVVTIDDSTIVRLLCSTVAAIRNLRRLKPDTYVDLEVYSNLAACLSVASGAARRIGFVRRSADAKARVYTDKVFFNTSTHISDLHAVVLATMGGVRDGQPRVPLAVTADDRAECVRVLAAHGVSDPHPIVVNCNASALMLERRWPTASWQRCLDLLVRAHPTRQWVLIGHEAERSHVAAITAAVAGAQGHIVNLAGALTIGGVMALLERCALVVSGDTGPLHMAAALGCRTVSIWGPTSPMHLAPQGTGHITIAAHVPCAPCLHQVHEPPCQGHNICMSLTPSAQVASAITAALAHPVKVPA